MSDRYNVYNEQWLKIKISFEENFDICFASHKLIFLSCKFYIFDEFLLIGWIVHSFIQLFDVYDWLSDHDEVVNSFKFQNFILPSETM